MSIPQKDITNTNIKTPKYKETLKMLEERKLTAK